MFLKVLKRTGGTVIVMGLDNIAEEQKVKSELGAKQRNRFDFVLLHPCDLCDLLHPTASILSSISAVFPEPTGPATPIFT